VLCLDGITDARNLGAIFRCADQLGACGIVLPERRSAKPGDEGVIEASSGTAASVPSLIVPNLARALRELKDLGFWVYGAEADAPRAWGEAIPERTVLVFGSEGEGLRANTREQCDGLLSLPSHGVADSLNVAVAVGILCYEVRRQWDAG